MRKPKNYNLRIFELDKKDISYREIIKIIYKEYRILLTKETLEKKLTPVQKETIKSYISDKESKNIKLVLSVLENNQHGISAGEISNILRNEFNTLLHKQEVNKLIYRKLTNDVYYCKNTYRYSLKKFNTEQKNKKENKFDELINDYSSENVQLVVSNFFKNKLIEISTGNDKIDYLIKSVVKDNLITEAEELFLKNKAKEFSFEDDIIDKAKQLLEQNNPYLDNIIHIIFDDGIVSNEELLFLNEKTTENDFTQEFVNNRFWVIAFSEYRYHLLKLKGFDNIFKLIFIYLELNLNTRLNDDKLIEYLNIFSNYSIEDVVNQAEKDILAFISELLRNSEKIKNINYFLNEAYTKIVLSNTESFNLNNSDETLLTRLIKILNQEKIRLGSPDVNLLVENVKYRIENELWD